MSLKLFQNDSEERVYIICCISAASESFIPLEQIAFDKPFMNQSINMLITLIGRLAMRGLFLISSLSFGLFCSISLSFADDTGMAGIHDLRREGGRLCQVGHFHYGNGTGPTKKAATSSAIASWSDFTALEYGSDWARFYRAANRGISCSKSSGEVSCSVEARPCR